MRPPSLIETALIVIETERLALRELVADDAAFMLELLNEPAFLRHIGDKGVRDLKDARDYIAKGPGASYRQRGYGLYRVGLRAGDAAVGICGLVKREALDDPDLGFAFLARYRSQGYASEAAAAVLDHGRSVLKLDRIVAITTPENRASRAVLEKVGLRIEGMIRLTERDPELILFGPSRVGSAARAVRR